MKTAYFLLSSTCIWAQLAAPNAAGVTLGHQHMTVADPAAHRKIWTGLFGALVISESPLMMKLPGIFLGFEKGTPAGGSEGSAVDHFAFGVKDLDGTREKLKAAGVEIGREVAGPPREVVAIFPDKIKIEFYEDTKLPTPLYHHHIHFSTNDVEGLREWYVKAFGAEVARNGNAVTTTIPGTALSFRRVDTPAPPTKGRSLDHIGFDVRDVDAFCTKLTAIKILCERPTPASKVAFLTDPSGSSIEITQGFGAR